MISNKFDYLIIGAGLAGATAANILHNKGYKVIVIDKRNHIGGNCYCENIEDINIHTYGAHIFHTNNKEVWDYVNSFVIFNNYTHQVIANYKGELYNLPFNMNTFIKIFNVRTPDEVLSKINSECVIRPEYNNLEEWVLGNVGNTIYEKLIKHYTEKQWQKKCCELPTDIIKRLPLRMTFNNNYFNDKYQGIPKNGYNELFKRMLDGIDVILDTDYFDDREFFNNIADKIIYTGPIDKYFNYCFGKLDYRSLRFETEVVNTPNYQGCSVMNYTDKTPYTRIIEHKHFETLSDNDIYKNTRSVITKEYPDSYIEGTNEPYYPVHTKENIDIYNKYKELSDKENKVLFIGRLAEYKYYDMDDTIENVLLKIN